jgi:hypothetical protein
MNEPLPGEDDNHALHYNQHVTDIQVMRENDPTDERIEALEVHAEWHEEMMEDLFIQHPALESVPWDSMFYDPYAPAWKKLRWQAELDTVLMSELLATEGIKNTDEQNLRPNDNADNSNLPDSDKTTDILRVHDIVNNRYILLPARLASGTATGAPFDENVKPLLETTWDYPNRVYLPLVLRRRPHIDDSHGDSPLHGYASMSLALPVIKEMTVNNRSIRRHVRAHAKYSKAFGRGTLDNKARRDLAQETKTIIELPAEALATQGEVKPPPIPQTLLDYNQILKNKLDNILGISAQSTGAAFPHQITATESAERAAAQSERIENPQKIIGQFLKQVGMGFLELYARYGLPGGIPVPIETPTGRALGRFTPEDVPQQILRLEYDVPASTPNARAQEAQQKQNYYQILMGSGVGDPRKVMEAWGRTIGESDPTRLFIDQLPPTAPPQQIMAEAQGQTSLASIPGGGQQGPQGANLRLAGGGVGQQLQGPPGAAQQPQIGQVTA